MQYNPPYGSADPNAPFVNGNPATGTEGSIPPAEQMEFPQREIVGVIAASGQTPANADQLQLTKAIRGGQLDFSNDFGGPDALVGSVALAHSRLLAGMPFTIFKKNVPNQTAAPTLTITGPNLTNPITGPITKLDGSAVAPGDLRANSFLSFRSDGNGFRLLASVLPSDVANFIAASNRFYTVNDGGSADALSGVAVPSLSALSYGQVFFVNKGVTPNQTNAPKLTVCKPDGTPIVTAPIVSQTGNPIAPNDLGKYATFAVLYNGTNFQLCGILSSDYYAAIQNGQALFASLQGQDTYTGAPSLVPGVAVPLTTGQKIVCFFNNTNQTTSPTLNWNGLGAKSILNMNGLPVAVGDLSGFIGFIYSGSGWLADRALASQIKGRLLRTTVYQIVGGVLAAAVDGGASGAVPATFTPLTYTTAVEVEVQGGGAGAGGTAACSSSQQAVSGGGGGGARAVGRYTSGFAGAVVTIGAGGAGALGPNTGAAGGTSSFGTLCSAAGGNPSPGGGTNTNASFIGAPGSGGTLPTSGTLYNGIGQDGTLGIVMPNAAYSGKGGWTVYGGSQAYVGQNNNGQSAVTPGAGGSGCCSGPGSGTQYTGGNGAPGIVIVREYA